MNLVGYFLKALLQRGIVAGGPPLYRPLIGLRCLIRSEEMQITIAVQESSIEIRRGRWPRIDTTVEAELVPLMRILTKGGLMSAWLEGRVAVRGKAWRMLPLLRLLRAGLTPVEGPKGGT
ncbi:MAG: hypothetical protein O6952_08785 [Planctomycetota bacterium]|nr:hypothetical protein [Planctomycetota bacterium]